MSKENGGCTPTLVIAGVVVVGIVVASEKFEDIRNIVNPLGRQPIIGPGPGHPRQEGLIFENTNVRRWEKDINRIAASFNLDGRLLQGVVAIESAGNPNARSKSGAQGLAQIMPATWRELQQEVQRNPILRQKAHDLGIDSTVGPTNPEANLYLSSLYLFKLGAPQGSIESWNASGRGREYLRQAEAVVQKYHDGPRPRAVPSPNARRYQSLMTSWLQRFTR